MNKLIFFDIDGTLITQQGIIPPSTIETLKKLKENGHCIFICSGRSKGEMPKSLLDLGFDGMVASAGAYVEYRNTKLFHRPLKENHLREIVDFFEKEEIGLILETNEGAFFTSESYKNFTNLINKYPFTSEEAKNEYLGIFKIEDNLKSIRKVNKLVYFNSKYTVEELISLFDSKFTFLPSSIYWCKDSSGEISEKGIHKATGIEILLSHLSKTKDDVIAVGDGLNDLEMVSFAGTGIAMGNSDEQLKKIADFTTDDVSEDGILKIFKKLNYI